METVDALSPAAKRTVTGAARRKTPRRSRRGVTVYLPSIQVAQALLDGEDVGALEDAREAVRAAIDRRQKRG
jgi:hypothetical protein